MPFVAGIHRPPPPMRGLSPAAFCQYVTPILLAKAGATLNLIGPPLNSRTVPWWLTHPERRLRTDVPQ